MKKRLILVLAIVLSFSINYLGCSDNPVESDVPNLPKLVLSNFHQTYSAPYGKSFTTQTIIRISSSTDKVLNYTMSNNSDWLYLTSYSGSLEGHTPDSGFFTFQVSSPVTLEYGTYYDTITIFTDSSAKNTLQKEIVLHIGSEITVEPEEFEFFANLNGENPYPQALDVNSTSSEHFDFTLSDSVSWLNVSNLIHNTIDTDNVPVSINIAGLSAGVHVDTIWVNSDSASNSPFPVPVQVNIQSWMSQQSPYSTNHNLNDVYFADTQNGWAVGDIGDFNTNSGFILKTTDGGLNWEKSMFLSSTTSSDSLLAGVTFIGNDGWIVGASRIIMHSNNFGADWSFQSPPAIPVDTVNFNDVFFISADSGWIVGDTGVILATSDGGVNWNLQTTPTLHRLSGISFVDNMNGWVSGYRDVILATSDGGQTWIQQTIPNNPITIDKYDFKEIMFTDIDNGWAVGKFGLVLSTVDGGTTWNYQQVSLTTPTTGLQSLFFINSTTGWVTGQSGEVLKTTDGGTSWTNLIVETTSLLNSTFFLDENNGWIVGSEGTMLRTASGGE